jgi:hypothetical protein
MTKDFDTSALNKRIAEVKRESDECTTFTIEFVDCLMKRHDLQNMLQSDQQFDDIPQSIVENLVNGKCPTIEDLFPIDIDSQDAFIKDLVWICGMGAISWYCDNEDQYKEMDPKPFDEIIKMPEMSVGHHSASFIIAALVLLTATVTPPMVIELLSNNFDCGEEQLEKNAIIYNDLCFCILKRFKEDLNYFAINNEYKTESN